MHKVDRRDRHHRRRAQPRRNHRYQLELACGTTYRHSAPTCAGAPRSPTTRSDMTAALEQARARADVVVTSGGLGPTDDDRTVDVVSALAGVEPVQDAGALRARCACASPSAASGSTPNNLRQVRVPAGAEVLANAKGAAPGLRRRASAARAHLLDAGRAARDEGDLRRPRRAARRRCRRRHAAGASAPGAWPAWASRTSTTRSPASSTGSTARRCTIASPIRRTWSPSWCGATSGRRRHRAARRRGARAPRRSRLRHRRRRRSPRWSAGGSSRARRRSPSPSRAPAGSSASW